MHADSIVFFALGMDSHDSLEVILKAGVFHIVEEVDFQVVLHHLERKS